MKRPTQSALRVLAVPFVLVCATSVLGAPAKAKRINVDMVSAYNQCTAPTLTHRLSLAHPACVPTLSTENNANDQITFGLKGRMNLQLQKGNGDVTFKVKGSDIRKNGGPANGFLQIAMTLRITDTGCEPLPFVTACTVVDFPFPLDLSCTGGRCSVKTTANAILPGALHDGDTTNMEVSDIVVLDDDGDRAFAMGLLIP